MSRLKYRADLNCIQEEIDTANSSAIAYACTGNNDSVHVIAIWLLHHVS